MLVIKRLQQKVPGKVVHGFGHGDFVHSIGCLQFIHSDWSKFQGPSEISRIIRFLCSTNEHNIPVELNRFQVVSGVLKKV